ncbi:MAG: T9SS type A sorting domain-containing protein [Ignavibacteria bacterium]
MSTTNSQNEVNNGWIIQMTVQTHDYAGTFAPNQPPGPSDIQSMRLDFSLWTANSENIKIPEGISLKQNSPNPFNLCHDLEFKISKTEFVSLKVYDVSGREVKTIVNKELNAGNYKYSFDASGLTSGIYFYTLKTNGSNITKRMLLLK